MLPIYEFLLAIALDLVIGQPAWLIRFHPKHLVEMLSDFLEGVLREKMGFELKTAGVLLTLLVIAATMLLSGLLSGLGWVVRVILMYLILSSRRLTAEAVGVTKALKRHDLSLARQKISALVARDTDRMTEEDVARATVEHIGLNLCDRLVAPLFFIAIGSCFGCGAVLGWLFLSVDTLDSKIGYKNDQYIDLGRFTAKLDDVLTFIPAWLTGWLIVGAAGIARLDAPGAVRVMDRDHATQSSPNGGWGMAAVAGALGIRLGGDIRIGGVVMHKRALGDNTRPAEQMDIVRSIWLIYLTYLLAAALFCILILIF